MLGRRHQSISQAVSQIEKKIKNIFLVTCWDHFEDIYGIGYTEPMLPNHYEREVRLAFTVRKVQTLIILTGDLHNTL